MKRPCMKSHLAIAVAAMTLWSSQVSAADADLCDFVAKIGAARSNGFLPYRGAHKVRGDPKMEVTYVGTLLPEDSLFCEMTIRTREGKQILGASYYACGVGTESQQFQTFSAADALYDKTVAALRACFPNVPYKETKQGEPNHTSESFAWSMEATMPGYTVDVQMENALGMMTYASKNIPITATSPLVAITLIVNDEAK